MAFNPIALAINAVTGALVNYNGAALSIPALFQGDTRDIQISLLIPGGTPGSYTVFNGAGITMYLTIGATPEGTGGQTIYAGPLAMNWSAALSAWTGSINLTGAALASAIGSGPSVAATVGVDINTGVIQTVYQNTLVIYAPENPGGVVVPQPPVNYLTSAQIAAGYVPQNGGANGQGFFLISPAGTKRFISLNDDGTLSIA